MTHHPTDPCSDSPVYTNSDNRGEDLGATIEGPALYALIGPYNVGGPEYPHGRACQEADYIVEADGNTLQEIEIWVIGHQDERDVVLCHGYRWKLSKWDDWAYAPSFQQASEQALEKYQDREDEYHE